MISVPSYDLLDRRVLALLVFTDALGARVRTPVSVRGQGVRCFAKRPGEIVIADAPGFADYTAAFAAPPFAAAIPTVGSVPVQLDIRPADPGHGARRIAVALPRNPNPGDRTLPSSLFQPVEVALLPTPASLPRGQAAVFSASVRRATDQRRIEGALVRLSPAGLPQARALTDAAGDALLLVAGVPLGSAGPGATVLPDIAADLDVIVDPALARFHADAELDQARADASSRRDGLIDPDDLETRLAASATPPVVVRIAAGRQRGTAIAWTPPP
jgi:hypothetical protein